MSLSEKIKAGCADLATDCRAAARSQSDALDGVLPPTRRIGLWLHLLICRWCRRYGNQIRFLRAAAHEHEEKLTQAVPQNLSGEARARIKRRLQADN